MRFKTRADAGRRLALRLRRLSSVDPVVLGIARGGVPVAFEVARALRAPLDVVVVRRLVEPADPEVTLGAIGEDGVVVDRDRVPARSRHLANVIAREKHEIARRLRAYRDGRPPVPYAGRTVILVDDGIATGGTMRAAIGVVRRRGARRIVAAAPIAAHEAIDTLRELGDDVVGVEVPPVLGPQADWYEETALPSEQSVIEQLDRAASGSRVSRPSAAAPGYRAAR